MSRKKINFKKQAKKHNIAYRSVVALKVSRTAVFIESWKFGIWKARECNTMLPFVETLLCVIKYSQKVPGYKVEN